MPSQDTWVSSGDTGRCTVCLLFGSYFGRKVFQIRETSWNTLGARDTGETSWESCDHGATCDLADNVSCQSSPGVGDKDVKNDSTECCFNHLLRRDLKLRFWLCLLMLRLSTLHTENLWWKLRKFEVRFTAFQKTRPGSWKQISRMLIVVEFWVSVYEVSLYCFSPYC